MTTTYECMNCGAIRTPGPTWIGCEDRLGASCQRYPTTTAKRLKAGDILISALGYPAATLHGEIIEVWRSPAGSVVHISFEAGEMMLWPTDVVEVAR